MLPAIQIGPLSIQSSGLISLLGIWLGLILAERQAERCGIKINDLNNLILIGLICGILGARFSYLLRYPQVFAASPLSVISPTPNLLDPLGGIAAGLLGCLFYARRKLLSLKQVVDALTPFMAVIQLSQGFAHLASGAAYGTPSELPWAIDIWGASRHPSQVYEILAGGLILALVWPGRGLIRPGRPGFYFLSFLALSAGARLVLEAFRGDSSLLAGGFRAVQVGAWLVLALALVGLDRLRRMDHSY